jgi:hypothetical protein
MDIRAREEAWGLEQEDFSKAKSRMTILLFVLPSLTLLVKSNSATSKVLLNPHRQAQTLHRKHHTQAAVRLLRVVELELEFPFHSRDIPSHHQEQMSLLHTLRIRQTCPRWRPF